MNIIITFMVLSGFGASQAQAFGHRAPPVAETPPVQSIPVPVPSTLVPTSPRPTHPRINVRQITGATNQEMPMIYTGVALAEKMLDNPCYQQWVSAARYTENNNLASPQVYALQASQASTIDIEMYYENNHVVGFEYDPYDGVVHMNRKFVNTASMVADNILHEDRGHGLGFHHYGKFSTSVPYGANYAYEGCSVQMQRIRGAKAYKPPGIRIQIRKKRKRAGR